MVPILALDEKSDPLADSLLSFAGAWGAAVPVVAGGFLAVPSCIFLLRRISRRLQPGLSFIAGIFIGRACCCGDCGGFEWVPLAVVVMRDVYGQPSDGRVAECGRSTCA